MPTPWYPASSNTANRNLRGWKRYELTNHLGNVLAVVSDKHLSQDVDANNKVDFYFADVISAQDYWPFGSVIAERQFVASGAGDYRYGFNGKEQDGDFGNQYDYGFRIYNPQIARFLSEDPLSRKYPWFSPYQFAGNNPILFIDMDGLEPLLPGPGVSIQKFGANLMAGWSAVGSAGIGAEFGVASDLYGVTSFVSTIAHAGSTLAPAHFRQNPATVIGAEAEASYTAEYWWAARAFRDVISEPSVQFGMIDENNGGDNQISEILRYLKGDFSAHDLIGFSFSFSSEHIGIGVGFGIGAKLAVGDWDDLQQSISISHLEAFKLTGGFGTPLLALGPAVAQRDENGTITHYESRVLHIGTYHPNPMGFGPGLIVPNCTNMITEITVQADALCTTTTNNPSPEFSPAPDWESKQYKSFRESHSQSSQPEQQR